MAEDHDEKDLVELFLQRAADTSTLDAQLKLIKFMSVAGIHCPRLQHDLCARVVGEDGGAGVPEEDRWNVLEITARAALAVGQSDAARRCLDLLRGRFQNSLRVERLRLLVVEVEGGGGRAKAEAGYTQLLAADEADTASAKRLIALKKASGSLEAAAEALRVYLDGVGSGDASGWLDAAETHLELVGAGAGSSKCVQQAIFCMEELALLLPTNGAYHVRLCELLTSLAGRPGVGQDESTDRTRMARLHGSEGVRLTNKASPYAVVALADACYAHWRVSSGRPVGHLLVLPATPASTLPQAVRALGGAAAAVGVAASSTEKIGNAVRTDAAKASREEDEALHAYACVLLTGMRGGGVGERTRRQAAAVVSSRAVSVAGRDVFPALALEEALLSRGVEEKLRAQSAAMQQSGGGSGTGGEASSLRLGTD